MSENDYYLLADQSPEDFADRILRVGLVKPRTGAASGSTSGEGPRPVVTRYLSGLRTVRYDLSGVDPLRADAVPVIDVAALLAADTDVGPVPSFFDFCWEPVAAEPVAWSDPYTLEFDTFLWRAGFAIPSYSVTFSISGDEPMFMPSQVQRDAVWAGYA